MYVYPCLRSMDLVQDGKDQHVSNEEVLSLVQEQRSLVRHQATSSKLDRTCPKT